MRRRRGYPPTAWHWRLGALLCLSMMALAWAWPLVANLTTVMPGGPADHDVATMVWNVGHVHRALATGQNLLHTSDVLVPEGADLRLHTYALLNGLLAAPFVNWLGVLGAYNLTLLLTLVLNGAMTYLLVERVTRNRSAAVLAGVCLMLASPVLFQFRVGRPAFAAVWTVAAALLAAHALLHHPRWWKAAGLGLALLAALLSDVQVLLFAALWLSMLLVYEWRRTLKTLHWISLSLALVAVPFVAVYVPAFLAAEGAGYGRPFLDDMRVYSYRFWDFVSPDTASRVLGFDLLLAVVGGIVVLGWRGGHRFWLAGSLILVLLALGPFLQPTDVPLPFALLGQWGPLAQFRTPSRLVMPAALGLSVLLGLVFARATNKLTRSQLGAILALAIGARLVLALVQDPMRVQAYPSYALYQQLASEPSRATLLEVPFGVRSGLDRIGSGGEVLSVYQSVHGKPLVNAMIARVPGHVLAAYRGHPTLVFLSGEPIEPPSSEEFDATLRWLGAGNVVLHRSLLQDDQRQRIEAFLDAQPGIYRSAVEDDVVLYRAAWMAFR